MASKRKKSKAPTAELSPALAAALEKHLPLMKKKFCYGLPHYAKSAKLEVRAVEAGSLELFEENEVDGERCEGWLPLAELVDEPQFLTVFRDAPFAVGMWEHETGEVMPVAPAIDAFVAALLPTKKSPTPYERLASALDAVSTQLEARQYSDALAAIEQLVSAVPSVDTDVEDELLGRLNNLWGLALNGVGRHREAIDAFERGARAQDRNARLNVLDTLLEHTREPQRAIERIRAAQSGGYIDGYERFWLALYTAIASLELGDASAAERALREIVAKHRVLDAAKVDEARERVAAYARSGRPKADEAQSFLSWIVPKSYAMTPEQAAEQRAFWEALPEAVRDALWSETNPDDDDHGEPTDEQIARCFDVQQLTVEGDEPIDDVSIFLRFTELTRLEFEGHPESIEPLRALSKLEALSINGSRVRGFAWPSRAQKALWEAAKRGDRDGVTRALEQGADLHARSSEHGRGAIHFATEGHRVDLVCWLVELGADPWAGTHLDSEAGVLGYFGSADRARIVETALRAGVKPIEDEPYVAFSAARVARVASFEAPDVSLDGDIDDGVPLAHQWPSDVVLAMKKPKTDNKLTDVMVLGYDDVVVSERVAEVLRGRRELELLPVTLARHDGSRIEGRYFIPNPLGKDCLEIERCYASWNHINEDQMSEIAAFAIDPTRVEGAGIFRPARLIGAPIIVTRELSRALAAFDGARIDVLRR